MRPEIVGPAGRLEAILDEPAGSRGVSPEGLLERGGSAGLRAAVVFGHPHPQMGGTMHTKAVYQATKTLARLGCAVLRFNFRGVGTSAGTFDNARGEMDDFRAGLDFMQAHYPDAPIWAAGMSFGAWIAWSVGADDPRVSLLLGLAVPASRYDLAHVAASPKPKFFIHGEFDEVSSLKDVRALYARAAEPKEIVVIDTSNHTFDGRVSEVTEAIEDLLGDWRDAAGTTLGR